jgi:radical SAM protein with 4Fe4S-binding SPASM domain
MKKRFRKIYIEITNVCNLSCSFCPKTKRKPEYMSLELFENIITQAKPLTQEITLHVMGEPLLHPKFEEIIECAHKHNVKINLTTNATFIKNKEKILLNNTIKRINFSLQGIKTITSKETQIAHLKEIITFTKLAQKKRDDLLISYRLWNINDESNKDMLNFIENEFNSKCTPAKHKSGIQITKNTYINFDNSFSWPSQLKKQENETGYCHGLSTHIGILAGGEVVPCCLDNDANILLGNIKDNTLLEIVESKKATDMKKGFQERKLIHEMCKKCSFIYRLDKNK